MVVVVIVCVCVCVRGGGGEAILKIKKCGGNACPPTLILAFVLPTVACSLDYLTKANPDGSWLVVLGLTAL